MKTKLNADGSIERRKARLVAKGFMQIPGVDFDETFAAVDRIGSIRTLMVELDMNVYQLDFGNAYLNGDIKGNIYMAVPENFDALWPGRDQGNLEEEDPKI